MAVTRFRTTASAVASVAGLLLAVMTVIVPQVALGDDDLRQRATWEWADLTTVRKDIEAWADVDSLEEDAAKSLDNAWAITEQGGDLLQPILNSVSVVNEDARKFVTRCRAGQFPSAAQFDGLMQKEWPPLVGQSLRLLYGKTLAISELYNEAHEVLKPLTVSDSPAPATLMFYSAAVDYRLREFKSATSQLERLLERESELPERYGTIASLMLADLKQLKPDSLDEIARIMDSIKVRLKHGRAGTRVREEEQEVIDKLSKMIEEKEKQLQQMQAQSGGAAGENQPSRPMQDSQLPGGGGAGDVDAKKLSENADWGNLPPKERKEALQALGKEFPSHYRSVIEEYFRNLAKDDSDSP